MSQCGDYSSNLIDDQWRIIKHELPPPQRLGRKPICRRQIGEALPAEGVVASDGKLPSKLSIVTDGHCTCSTHSYTIFVFTVEKWSVGAEKVSYFFDAGSNEVSRFFNRLFLLTTTFCTARCPAETGHLICAIHGVKNPIGHATYSLPKSTKKRFPFLFTSTRFPIGYGRRNIVFEVLSKSVSSDTVLPTSSRSTTPLSRLDS